MITHPSLPADRGAAPIIHLASWNRPQDHGPGRKLSIMALPKAHERGDGRVWAFTPSAASLQAVQAGRMSRGALKRSLLEQWAEWKHRPRAAEGFHILANPHRPGFLRSTVEEAPPVRTGDTLLCACDVRWCHRRLVAPVLHEAGWSVVLDGESWHPTRPPLPRWSFA